MFEPILLNKYGEKLNKHPDASCEDERRLSSPIGLHAFCNGWVDIRKVSETHQAIICRVCKLRIIIPIEIKNYGDLRKYFINKNERT